MSRFLDPTGKTTYGIGVCARCQKKMSLDDLHPDPNTPGLLVCEADLDDYDPYRLPPKAYEEIHLRFSRPDTIIDPPTTEVTSTTTPGIWEDGIWSGWSDDSWVGMP